MFTILLNPLPRRARSLTSCDDVTPSPGKARAFSTPPHEHPSLTPIARALHLYP